ncbi:unnamed protein product [Xylocopa violacea]|uniref:Uncharacterized protein n=1 Tax=Xylocopa violacea TaxID=135666 RepID=A0ABP1NFR0_XYLVO
MISENTDGPQVHLILLMVPIFADLASSAFTFEPMGVGSRGRTTRAVWTAKGHDDSGDYKVNKGYSSAYSVKDDGIKKEHVHGNYKDGGAANKQDASAQKSKQGSHHDGQGVGHHQLNNDKKDHGNGQLDNDDGYKHKYQRGYHRTHGYHHRHHHGTDGTNHGGDGDDYGGYYRVRFVHKHKDKNDESRLCSSHGDCKHGGYNYDDGFEYHYGNNGANRNEHGHNGGGHGASKEDDIECNHKYKFGNDHNEGIGDHGPDYYYGYTQSGGNYAKGYPGFGRDHYRHHELDQDHADYHHGLAHRNY